MLRVSTGWRVGVLAVALLAGVVGGCRRSSPAPLPAAGDGLVPPPARAGTVALAPASSPVDEICVGLAHSCAKTLAGDVFCWGDNDLFQVAPTDEPQYETPRKVTEFPPSDRLRCGARETCAKTQAGEVYCLGGSRGAEKLALPGRAQDLVLYAEGGCVLLEGGRVMCWQRPARSVASPTAGSVPVVETREPQEVPALQDAQRFERAPSFADAVCVEQAGGPRCVHELYRGGEAAVVLEASELGSLARAWASPDPVVAVYPGGFCARDATKAMRCEGEANPLAQGIPAAASTAAIGFDHACALVEGAARCWGAEAQGQLGNAPTYRHPRPTRVPGITDVVAIDASPLQTCVVHDGKVACWGVRPTFVAGVEMDFVPKDVDLREPALEVRAASIGAVATAQEQRIQPLYVRGASGWWHLTQGWERGAPTPATPLGRFGVRVSQLSRDGQCAVDVSHRLVCAGGADRPGDRTVKTKLLVFPSDDGFAEATSLFQVHGEDYVCGRTLAGRVRCFPAGERAEAAQPVASPTLRALADIVQVEGEGKGNDGVACALGKDGSVSCWGRGRWGQLGSAPPEDPFTAVAIALPPVARLAVGGTFVCALTRAREVYCWGSNRNGTAPDGQLGRRPEATAIVLPR